MLEIVYSWTLSGLGFRARCASGSLHSSDWAWRNQQIPENQVLSPGVFRPQSKDTRDCWYCIVSLTDDREILRSYETFGLWAGVSM